MKKPKLKMKYTLTVPLAHVDEIEDVIEAWDLCVERRDLIDGRHAKGKKGARSTHTKAYKTIPDNVICDIYKRRKGGRTAKGVALTTGLGVSTVAKIWQLGNRRYVYVLRAAGLLGAAEAQKAINSITGVR